MKKMLSFALLLAMVASFPSCKDDSQPNLTDDTFSTSVTEEQNTVSPDEETTIPEETSTAPTDEEETLSQEDSIKNAVIDLMTNGKSQKDPAELLAHFSGDFQITKFTSSQDGIQSIKRREAVTLVNAGTHRYYGIEAAGHMFYAHDYNRKAYMAGNFPLSADAPHASTIFTVFGIDTSALYTGDTDEEDAAAPLTADELTVSDDKAYCEFSKEYVDGMAKEICKTMGFSDAVTSSFLEKYTGSGIYSVAENMVTFDIQIKDKQIGTIHQTSKYAVDPDGLVYVYSYMKYSNALLGIRTPIIVEIECKDVEYRDNEPIRATIKLNTSSESSFRDGSVTVKLLDQIETTFRLDCSDTDALSASATCKKEQTEKAMGDSWTRNLTLSLSLDLGRSSSQFQYTQRQDKETLCSLKAKKVTFSESSPIVTPQYVVDEITAYIDEHYE